MLGLVLDWSDAASNKLNFSKIQNEKLEDVRMGIVLDELVRLYGKLEDVKLCYHENYSINNI